MEFSADFYLLLNPLDPARGNGRLFYEVGNRGTKAILRVFQKAQGAPNPTTAAGRQLVASGFVLPQDLTEAIDLALIQYDWVVGRP